MSELLETVMLICFGLSWPINLVKSIKSKTAKSTSFKFLLLITLGYLCGIAAKIVSDQINYVLAVYLLNLLVVAANIIVYFINAKRDKKQLSQEDMSDDR
ncbi:MAG: hypothetical protein E7571_07775 [Ruminococcaceae bacterium]|nr:hypothetical protein [Oscillospiraceae bacterium]